MHLIRTCYALLISSDVNTVVKHTLLKTTGIFLSNWKIAYLDVLNLD